MGLGARKVEVSWGQRPTLSPRRGPPVIFEEVQLTKRECLFHVRWVLRAYIEGRLRVQTWWGTVHAADRVGFLSFVGILRLHHLPVTHHHEQEHGRRSDVRDTAPTAKAGVHALGAVLDKVRPLWLGQFLNRLPLR